MFGKLYFHKLMMCGICYALKSLGGKMSKQYRYAGIWVEITRRCNMSCDHCSCGQELSMASAEVDTILMGY